MASEPMTPSHVRYATISAIGLVAVIGLLMTIAWLVVDRGNRDDQRDRDMIEARESSCLQQNAQVTRDREAAKHQAGASARTLILLATKAGNPPDPALSEQYVQSQEQAAFTQAVLDYPYRDCSPAGITAYFAKPPPSVPCKPDRKGYCN